MEVNHSYNPEPTPVRTDENAWQMLMEIDGLIADWRAGVIEDVFVMSCLSLMFPGNETAAIAKAENKS